MLLSLMASLLIMFSVQAQDMDHFQLSGFVTPQLNSPTYRVDGVAQSVTQKIGFQAGVGAKIAWDKNLYFSPELFYSLKSYNVDYNTFTNIPEPGAINNSYTVNTIELALLPEYDFKHWFIKTGPTIDLQLSGTEQFTLKDGNVVKRKIPFAFWKYGFVGINLQTRLGWQNEQFFVAGSWGYGLTNMANADDGPTIKYNTYGITIGLFINHKFAL